MAKQQVERFRSDSADYDRCMDNFGPETTRCEGGRIIVRGFVCPHCDSYNPDSECGAPRKEYRDRIEARSHTDGEKNDG
jgi:hypothetical protein